MKLNDSPLDLLEFTDESGESVAYRYPGLARVQLLLERGMDDLFESEDIDLNEFAF